MASEGWIKYNGTEIANAARTVALAKTLGIKTVVIQPGQVAYIAPAAQDDISAAAASTFTAVMENGVTSPGAAQFAKTGGTTGQWSGAVRSAEGYSDGASVSFRPGLANGRFMMGLNSDPAVDSSYGSIDYAMYYNGGNDSAKPTWSIFESGANPGAAVYPADPTDTAEIVYDGQWVRYYINGNLAHTTAVTGHPTLYLDSSFFDVSSSVTNVNYQHRPAGTFIPYGDITTAPWYDAGVQESWEFAGALALSMQGLDDSSISADVVEYTTDGGHNGKSRASTLSIVANFTLIATTERGAEYGRRWLNKILRGTPNTPGCAGADLTYFRYAGHSTPRVHRRNVKMTRGTSVTRKAKRNCGSTWGLTFTLTAADPYEYGESSLRVATLGAAAGATGPYVNSSGSLMAPQAGCPVYDYSPIFDPQYPALVAPPAPPDYYPAGYTTREGDAFQRYWARFQTQEPSHLLNVPIIKVTSTTDARMLRIALRKHDDTNDSQCGALFVANVTYLQANTTLYIDAVQKMAYIWDGVSPSVRRADSLVFGADAKPVAWTAFNDDSELLLTLDTYAVAGGGYQGGGNVRVACLMVPKSD